VITGDFRLSVLGVFEAEANFHRHLEMLDLTLDDVAADLRDLEPIDVPQRLRRAMDAVSNGLLQALPRRPDDLADSVGAV
jgi:hypothetical protein